MEQQPSATSTPPPVGPPPLPPPLQPFRPAAPLPASPDPAARAGLPLRGRDTIGLLFLAVASDVCLYPHWGGAGLAAIGLLALLVLWRLKPSARGARLGWIALAVPLLAAALLWSAWWLPACLIVCAIAGFAILLWHPGWTLLEGCLALPATLTAAPARLLGHAIARRKKTEDGAGRRAFDARLVLVPLLVSLFFLGIFILANPILQREFTLVGRHFEHLLTRLGDVLRLSRWLFWLGGLLFWAAMIRPLKQAPPLERLAARDSALAPVAGMTGSEPSAYAIAFATLVCVNLLFAAYNGMDAVYLYFRATLPDGITWTAYTHAGCGWLTFALFASTCVLGRLFWRDLNFDPHAPRLKALAYLWIAQNAVLAVGTLRRIAMYIDFSGLTHLLLTGVYGALLVMVGLVIMTVKIARNRNALWLLRQYATAFVVGLTLLAVTPHGWVCAAYNVPRVIAGKPHALWPVVLKELPSDALPRLIPLLDYRHPGGDPAKTALVQKGIAGLLGLHLDRLRREQTGPWSRRQVSGAWAWRRLAAVEDRLNSLTPPAQRQEARRRLKADYDLSGLP